MVKPLFNKFQIGYLFGYGSKYKEWVLRKEVSTRLVLPNLTHEFEIRDSVLRKRRDL